MQRSCCGYQKILSSLICPGLVSIIHTLQCRFFFIRPALKCTLQASWMRRSISGGGGSNRTYIIIFDSRFVFLRLSSTELCIFFDAFLDLTVQNRAFGSLLSLMTHIATSSFSIVPLGTFNDSFLSNLLRSVSGAVLQVNEGICPGILWGLRFEGHGLLILRSLLQTMDLPMLNYFSFTVRYQFMGDCGLRSPCVAFMDYIFVFLMGLRTRYYLDFARNGAAVGSLENWKLYVTVLGTLHTTELFQGSLPDPYWQLWD